ncbi:hypothetical protein BC829DRAFT_388249 [Chytridium lagenaria]|nr:hypothetical protein BC829DRAFT_388249 [Chytridium lagenaria]
MLIDEAAAGGMDAAGALATLPPPSYGAALMDNILLVLSPAELRNSYQESAYSPAPTSAYSPYPQASSSSNIPTSASSPPSQHFSYVEPHRATPALSPYPAAPQEGIPTFPLIHHHRSSMASHQKGNVNAGSGGFMVGNNHPSIKEKKKWLIVGLIVGILLVLVVLLSKKSGDGTAASGSAGSGSTAPASTLVPGASSGSPTTPSTTGALIPTAGFAINPSPATPSLPPSTTGDRSVREVFFSNGSTKLTLPNAGSPSSFDSFASADGYLFVLNDEYVSPAQTAKTGIVVIGAPTSPYSFTQVAPTISYPWSAVLVTPTTLIVSLGNGIVQEYLYTTQLAMSETTGLLYTAGLDARVSVRGGVATSLATFTGFGGEVYFVGVSEDGSEMAARRNAWTTPTFRFSVNVGFDIWKIAYHAPRMHGLCLENTDRPVLVAN